MKAHHYLFVFSESNDQFSKTIAGTLAVDHPRVTQATISKARAGLSVSASAVLLNVSYLGHMSLADFQSAPQ